MDWPDHVPIALSRLRYCRLRFTLQAKEEGRLPLFLGSALRGCMAMAFRNMVCTFNKQECNGCPVQRTCLYPALFETPLSADSQTIKRLRDIPHPIIVEPPLQHAIFFQRDTELSFDVILLGNAIDKVPYLIFAVNEMAEMGLGTKRLPFHLVNVKTSFGTSIYDAVSGKITGAPVLETLEESINKFDPSNAVTLYCMTPLRIKDQGKLSGRFDTDAFFKSACRRVWAILVYHHNVATDQINFHLLFENEPLPTVVSQSLEWCDLERYSNRQKTKMKIGGLVGTITLNGNLTPWWPILLAAVTCHVGKSTIMGLGQLQIISVNEPVHVND